MSRQYTRKQILQRAGAGAMGVSFAALLAACGGGGIDAGGGDTTADTGGAEPTTAEAGGGTTGEAGGATTSGGQLADKIVWSNWQLYLDTNEDETAYPTLEAFTEATGVQVEYLEGDINGNEEFFAKVAQQLEAGQDVGRDLIVLTDTSGVPGRMIELGYVEKLDKSAIPNAVNLQDALAHPVLRPGARVHDALAGGHDRDRLRPHEDRRGDHLSRAGLHRPEAQGQGHLPDGDARYGRARDAAERRRSDRGDRRRLRPARSRRSRPPSTPARCASSPATSTPRCSPAGDVWVSLAWSGDIVQLQPDNPNLQWVAARRGQHDLDRPADDPEGRRRLHAPRR